MPKVKPLKDKLIQKTFRIKPETFEAIERIRAEEKGLSQGRIIDLAVEILDGANKPIEFKRK